MPRTEQQSLRQRSNINTECTEISKPDMMDCRISDVDGMKVLYPSDFGCGVEFLPPFLLRLFRRRKVMKNEKYYMDATTSQFFHGSVTTSDSAAPSSGSSSTGEGSSCGSNCDDHDVPLDSNDCDSFARGCTVSDSKRTFAVGVQSRSSASSTSIDALVDDLSKSQVRSDYKKSAIRPAMQKVQILPSDDCSESAHSQGTGCSILSTATPFCVFNDDDNNTVVSFKVVHQPMYNSEPCITDEYLPDSSNAMRNTQKWEDPEHFIGRLSVTSSNHHGDVADVWSSNWNEMYDDDTITSAGTIMSRELRRQKEVIVLVRSRYSYAQENALRLNGSNNNSSVTNDQSDFVFPWEAYKKAISSGASVTSVKQPKLSSRKLPRNIHGAAYMMVEL